jgi:hypothetical protein
MVVAACVGSQYVHWHLVGLRSQVRQRCQVGEGKVVGGSRSSWLESCVDIVYLAIRGCVSAYGAA